jgi:hypothetical protein
MRKDDFHSSYSTISLWQVKQRNVQYTWYYVKTKLGFQAESQEYICLWNWDNTYLHNQERIRDKTILKW